MLFGAMLVHADHAALENRIVALDRIGVDIAPAHIFFGTVINGVVGGELFPDRLVLIGLVSHQAAFAADVGAENRDDIRNAGALDMKAPRRSAALHKGQHHVLVSRAALAHPNASAARLLAAVAFARTNERLVSFDELTVA